LQAGGFLPRLRQTQPRSAALDFRAATYTIRSLEVESVSVIIEHAAARVMHAAALSLREEIMGAPRDYEDIPGTYVYDAERGRVGYHLNMFCMSLNDPGNRKAFKADEAAYLDRFPLTPGQKDAVLRRDWLGMLKVGGNIYYTIKIAFCDGLTFQDVAGMMCSMPKEEYGKMMLAGGRIPTPQNLSKSNLSEGSPVKDKQ
jgi:protocatechuate 4,5-dioxygenase, alpha chain